MGYEGRLENGGTIGGCLDQGDGQELGWTDACTCVGWDQGEDFLTHFSQLFYSVCLRGAY